MNKTLRRPIIAGNWKMHNTPAQTKALLTEIKQQLPAQPACEVVLCVPYIDLPAAVEAAAESPLAIGAQNCHYALQGAFTGEISAPMLSAAGVRYAIVGHSERRQYFGETDETVRLRLQAVVNEGLTAILCVGEQLIQREQGITDEVVRQQLKIALHDLPAAQLTRLVVAYEPVWAIGTGKTATAAEADAVCGTLRRTLAELYDETAAQQVRILYGGSMNAQNAEELLAMPQIDGGLIGGASLKAADFAAIIAAANR